MLPEVESLRVQSLWLLKKALPSREEPDISSSIVNSKARFYMRALLARSESIELNRPKIIDLYIDL